MKLIINHDLGENEIGIGSDILPNQENGILELGQWRKEFVIRRFHTKEIHVPNEFLPNGIPLDVDYDWKCTGNILKLGPVIAFLISNKFVQNGIYGHYKKYMEHYPKVRGLVFISTTKQIDEEKKEIRGYYYHPDSQVIDTIERSFPLPDCIYKRCGSGKKALFQRLSQTVKIFNWPNLNKLAQYKVFQQQESLIEHFPKTKRLRSIKTVDGMLKEFPTLYLKPINKAKAKGISTISKMGKSYFLTKELERNELSRTELKQFLQHLKEKGKYIVQQGVLPVQKKNIVFRAILQKNERGEWLFSGGYARIGSEGSIITNRIFTKEFLELQDSFMKYYGMNVDDADLFIATLKKTCHMVCKGFDMVGTKYGDLAFDLMVDEDLKIWVIEVNNRHHNHRSPLLTLKDQEMYRRVVSTPLLYAKYLSGF